MDRYDCLNTHYRPCLDPAMWCLDCLCGRARLAQCPLCRDEVARAEWASGEHRSGSGDEIVANKVCIRPYSDRCPTSRRKCAEMNEKLLQSYPEHQSHACPRCSRLLRLWPGPEKVDWQLASCKQNPKWVWEMVSVLSVSKFTFCAEEFCWINR